jgi:outer membrane biosynthesis protein TonB
MAEQQNHNNFKAADIEKYWKGLLTAAEMHRMEKVALEDPLLSDAMEGYQQLHGIPAASAERDLAQLQNRLAERVSEPTVIPNRFNWFKPAIAALLLIIAGSAAWYFWPANPASSDVVLQPPAPAVTTYPQPDTAVDAGDPSPADVAVISPEKKKPNQPSRHVPAAESAAKNDETGNGAESVARNQKTELPVVPEGNAAAAPAIARAKELPLFDYKGIVLDETKKPVAGAVITLKGKVAGVSVVTDTSGRFLLPVADSAVQLTVSSTGYQSDKYQLSITDSTNDIAINLKPANAALNEVVVTGYSNKKKSAETADRDLSRDLSVKVQGAVPLPGWDEYNTYLQTKQIVPDSLTSTKGNVVLSFIVGANGKLSSFLVEQSLHPDLDREAIRLVKAGAPWKLLQQRKARVIVIVPF